MVGVFVMTLFGGSWVLIRSILVGGIFPLQVKAFPSRNQKNPPVCPRCRLGREEEAGARAQPRQCNSKLFLHDSVLSYFNAIPMETQ